MVVGEADGLGVGGLEWPFYTRMNAIDHSRSRHISGISLLTADGKSNVLPRHLWRMAGAKCISTERSRKVHEVMGVCV